MSICVCELHVQGLFTLCSRVPVGVEGYHACPVWIVYVGWVIVSLGIGSGTCLFGFMRQQLVGCGGWLGGWGGCYVCRNAWWCVCVLVRQVSVDEWYWSLGGHWS